MPRVSTWRRDYAPAIADTICNNSEATKREMKKLLRAIQPTGIRGYHPYKMWLNEVKTQLYRHFNKHALPGGGAKQRPNDPNQLRLL